MNSKHAGSALALIAGMAALAGATQAAAQEGKPESGAVDMGLEFAKNGDSRVNRLSSGMNTVSRLGFRGSEDLGGGLRANFRLEAGLNADDGTQNNATKFFGRWNQVGLS
ncbi:MAG: porin, partial [Massilia sp.]